MDVYEKLREMNLELPQVPAKGSFYTRCKAFGNGLYYVSGCSCNIGEDKGFGKLGKEYSVEEGRRFARNAILKVLAALQNEIGDLNKVKDVVKLLCFVASSEDFFNQPSVADGASEVLVQLFGEKAGASARSAVGVSVLPSNAPVEIEGIFSVKE